MAEEATPAAAPVAASQPTDSDDSIIGDILKGDPEEASGDTDGDDDADGPKGEVEGDDEHESDDSTDADAEPVADETPDDDAAEPDEPDSAKLKAARKAALSGDIEKALTLAFGKDAKAILSGNKLFTAVRLEKTKAVQAVQAREREHNAKVQQATQWVQSQRQQITGIIEQLRPYEEIHQARTAFQQSGDPDLLKAIIEKTTGLPYDEAQKIILTKSRRSPGERALQQQVQTLMQKLEEKERKQAEEAQQTTTQQQYQNDLSIISTSLKGEVTKVPRFAERVYKVLVDTKTPTGLSMTVEEAGRRVLAAERRKLAKHPLLPKAPPKPEVSEAARKLAQSKKTKGQPPVLRRDSRGNGAPDEKSESTDDILRDILPKKARATSV